MEFGIKRKKRDEKIVRGWKLSNCCAHHDAMTGMALATERRRRQQQRHKMGHAEIHSMRVTIMVTQSTQILMEL